MKPEHGRPDAAIIRQKVEIRFEKGEAVRFISHHDLMRVFQRAVRRACLPVRLTEGFNPRPRIVFPVALEVGIAALDEAAEIELTQWIPLKELETRLAQSLPPGLTIRRVSEIAPTRKGQTALEIQYKIHLAEQTIRIPPEKLTEMLAAPTLPFLRMKVGKGAGGRDQPQPIDLRAAIAGAVLDAAGDLVLNIKANQTSIARPLEVLSWLTGQPVETLRSIRVTKQQMRLETKQPPPEPQ